MRIFLVALCLLSGCAATADQRIVLLKANQDAMDAQIARLRKKVRIMDELRVIRKELKLTQANITTTRMDLHRCLNSADEVYEVFEGVKAAGEEILTRISEMDKDEAKEFLKRTEEAYGIE